LSRLQVHSSRLVTARAQMDGDVADGFTPLHGAFGPSRKAFCELANRTLNLAARLPAYATGSAPTDLAGAFSAARKELSARPLVMRVRGLV
jgi:hypothetical protein